MKYVHLTDSLYQISITFGSAVYSEIVHEKEIYSRAFEMKQELLSGDYK